MFNAGLVFPPQAGSQWQEGSSISPGNATAGINVHLSVQELVVRDGAGAGGRATHWMLKLGASVQMGAVRSVVKVGTSYIQAVMGSERVRVVVAVADSEAGQEPRKRRFCEHSQNGGPQVGEPGAKIMSLQVTPLVGAVACGGRIVRVVEATWFGQLLYDSWALRWFQV